ncbi:MAG: hypothetical protein ABFD54_07870 [Armatimonadota bacterium]|nr:hypothetical protein [bacterium]
MIIELNAASAGKLEDILEQLATSYDLDELQPDELIDALLDLGLDLLSDDAAQPTQKMKLVNYCGRKIALR